MKYICQKYRESEFMVKTMYGFLEDLLFIHNSFKQVVGQQADLKNINDHYYYKKSAPMELAAA